MSNAYLTANGHEITRIDLHVPNSGAWWAEVDFADESPKATGRCDLRVGSVQLVGTFDAGASGLFAGTRRARVIGGAGGWQTMIPARAYHNDAGVPRLSIVQDAAASVGEQVGFFEPVGRLAVDYVRPAGSAAETIKYAAGATPWWVGFDGLTHVGSRPSVPAGQYVLLNYNTRQRVATLDVDSIDAVGIGSVLTDRLDPPITVRDIHVTIDHKSLTFRVWHDDSPTTRGQLSSAMSSVVTTLADRGRLLGTYTYRVKSMVGDRCSLEAVVRDGSLPDLPYVSMWPGASGVHAVLSEGVKVAVQFLDGDRSKPIVTHFEGKSGNGFVPVSLDLCGNGSGLPVARQGDLVRGGGPGLVVTLWPVAGDPTIPAPVTGGTPHFISFGPNLISLATAPLAQPLYSAIDTGSALVRSG
jgi:hypothetical protein